MLPCCNAKIPYTLTQFVPGVAMVHSGYLDLQFAPNLTCSLRKVMPRYDQSSTGLRLRPGNLQNGQLGDTTAFDCIGGVPNCSNMGPVAVYSGVGIVVCCIECCPGVCNRQQIEAIATQECKKKTLVQLDPPVANAHSPKFH